VIMWLADGRLAGSGFIMAYIQYNYAVIISYTKGIIWWAINQVSLATMLQRMPTTFNGSHNVNSREMIDMIYTGHIQYIRTIS